MNLHEYQAKELFHRFGIPVPSGEVASTPTQAAAAAGRIGGKVWVVKAQVHAGGRGKAGGVKLARSAEEVGQLARDMLGTRLVTRQSGPQGMPVNQVYVEAGSEIDRELYLSLLVDRSRSGVAPPPTSRKFAGSPPCSLMRSIVAIARPAPFTMQAMLPSSET